MNKVIEDALKEWLKPRTVFATMFYSLFCYLILTKIEVPPILNTIVSTLFGYWSGSKAKKGKTNAR